MIIFECDFEGCDFRVTRKNNSSKIPDDFDRFYQQLQDRIFCPHCYELVKKTANDINKKADKKLSDFVNNYGHTNNQGDGE